MWRDYLSGYLKNNRSSGISIIISAFIAALFLSLLCCLAFNFWKYEVEEIILEEGDWQGRITGEIDEEDLHVIRNFANVEEVVINEELSGGKGTAADIYFINKRRIFKDMPLITKKLGLPKESASYHLLLLSRYLIHDPEDETPPLLLTFYLIVLVMVSASLILIIHNSFAVSMNARIHQFGIFSSVGAAPGQIRACLLQEAAVLCTIPVFLGGIFGIALSFGVIQLINVMAADATGRLEAVFAYHPLVLLITILSVVLTIFISARIPAVKLSRLTPIQAIRSTDELQLKRKRKSPVLSILFGIEGKLAGNALKAQKRALRTSTISLTLSFLGFTLILCFLTLSEISTGYTYFDRYQNAWDIMMTCKDTKIEDFKYLKELQEFTGVQDSTVYEKTEAISIVPKEAESKELEALGGAAAIAGSFVSESQGSFLVKAPVVILDDDGFAAYCRQIGVEPELDGAIILNRIWDNKNSNFRYKQYVPFIKEGKTSILQSMGQGEGTVELPVIAYTQKEPVLREEYENYTLVHFIPLSLWKKTGTQLKREISDTYIRILVQEKTSYDKLSELEDKIIRLTEKSYIVECENRVQEKLTNDNMMRGFKWILGAFCSLLALIGIANVLSNTLGFLRQRKREFARYMSIGLTPAGMRKMFCIEALVIAGRPLLITLPITAASVGFMIKASFLNPMEFIVRMPVVPVLLFILLIFLFVGYAYYRGGKKILKSNLSEALKSDMMV